MNHFMAIVARSSPVPDAARTALRGAAQGAEFASVRQSLFQECLSSRTAEPVQEIVVVPVREVVAQLPPCLESPLVSSPFFRWPR